MTDIVKNTTPFPSIDKNYKNIKKINVGTNGRKRSNSQSQVINLPTKPKNNNKQPTTSGLSNRRAQVSFYVTLLPLNDTFKTKNLLVANFPETTKLGRPTGTKHKPETNNGYFDSRVLSRNHAQIYISEGKLYLQDLGSSNGTYLNDVRLGNDPVEVKLNDIICLGFNVQAESTHKQISLKIDNINLVNTNEKFNEECNGHIGYIEKLISQVNNSEEDTLVDLSFENAVFGDVNDEMDDVLLGLYGNNMGIYNNSNIVNTSTLENVLNLLILNLTKVKQQSSTINNLNTFFKNYSTNLDSLNKEYLDNQFDKELKTIKAKLETEKSDREKLKSQLKTLKEENVNKFNLINDKLKSSESEKSSLNSYINELKLKNLNIEEKNKNNINIIKNLEAEKEKLVSELAKMSELADELAFKSAIQEQQGTVDQEEDISDAINGFIMDLSRTPSVRDNLKNLENNIIPKDTTIELTPPSSDDESESNEELPEQQPQVEQPQTPVSSSIILPQKEVEPFPKKIDNTTTTKESTDKQMVSTVIIAVSAMLIGFYLQKLVN
ncbi:unnamed protein product [Candida verbasci]|uniref:FHA domain-containing protein n=1 Tax=Candida verbasci TaxID=1227364 RepID=A0A9W4TUC6_9ASCO|nr:unnamed protein product [Candida verbasci]